MKLFLFILFLPSIALADMLSELAQLLMNQPGAVEQAKPVKKETCTKYDLKPKYKDGAVGAKVYHKVRINMLPRL